MLSELYQPGIAERTLPVLFENRARELGDAPYLLFGDASYSYQEALENSKRAAGALVELGVGPRDRVALVLENSAEFLWIIYGLGLLGACAIPLNTAAKGAQLAHYLNDSEPSHILTDEPFESNLLHVRTGRQRVIGVHGARSGCAAGVESYFEALGRASAIGFPANLSFRDLWMIMYTSGTTGPSKGVMCHHAHPLSVAAYFAAGCGFTPEDRLYASQPLFHGAALWWAAFAAMWAGSSVAVAPRFSASQFWKDVCRYRATQFSAVMSMVAILNKAEPDEFERTNPAKQGFVIPVPQPRDAFEQRTGVKVTTNFAMTEIHPISLLPPSDVSYDKVNSAGRICDHDDVVIANDDGIPVPRGTIGEILMRPREPWTISSGYWRRPEATAEAWLNLWFHTGDLGYVDEDNYLYFCGRKKDAIRRRGENISAQELEAILSTHPDIADCSAVGMPSEMGEEDVAVYVVRKGAFLREDDVVRYAASNMAYYMVPRYVKFVEELPQTESFKIKKYMLREEAMADPGSFWDREAAGIRITRTGLVND